MKRILYFLISLGCVLASSAQVCSALIDDFENHRDLVAYTTPNHGSLDEKIANPNPSGINKSSLCGNYRPSEESNGNFVLETKAIKNADLFRQGILGISMQFYGYISTATRLYLRKKGSNALTYPAGRHTALKLAPGQGSGMANTWSTFYFEPETYTIDNTLHADSIGEIEFQVTGDVYFDNIQIVGGYTAIDDFDGARNNTILSSSGTLNTSFLNNAKEFGNSSSRYAVYEKPSAAPYASIIYDAANLDPRVLVNGASLLNINILSADIATVRVSLVQKSKYLGGTSTQGVHSIYEGTNLYGTEWEFVSLANVPDASLSLHPDSVDAIVLQFDPGVQTAALYKFDNFLYYKSQVKHSDVLEAGVACVGPQTYAYSVIHAAEDAQYTWTWSEGATVVGAAGASVNVLFGNDTPAIKFFKAIVERPNYCDVYSTTEGTVTIFTAGSAACTVTGLEEVSQLSTVDVYPNPSIDGRFVVRSTEAIQEIIVTDMLGRQEKHLINEFVTQLSGLLVLKVKTVGQAVHVYKVSALK